MTTDLSHPGSFSGPVNLLQSPQDLTTSWVDLGSELDVEGAKFIALFVTLDINSSNNARVRLVARHTSGGDEFVLAIKTTGASDIKVEDAYYEFNVDSDQLMVLTWDLDGLIPYVKFQVQVSAVGATAAQIDTAHVTTAV